MDSFVLKVSTESMRSKADSIKNNINTIKTSLDSIESIISKSGSYWEGKAQEKHKNIFVKTRSQSEKVLNRLDAYPDDLLKMAGIYNEGEKQSIQDSVALPNNILS